jgi:hypothetical protein
MERENIKEVDHRKIYSKLYKISISNSKFSKLHKKIPILLKFWKTAKKWFYFFQQNLKTLKDKNFQLEHILDVLMHNTNFISSVVKRMR